jgi:heme exporter protein CcmD
MPHWPFITAAYGLAAATVLWLVADASLRTARARRRLAAVDRRSTRVDRAERRR